jgi:ethanolamine utilization protein EutN
MQLATVVGHTTSIVKHPSLAGQKLLVVQSYGVDGQSPDGEPVIAIDTLGAGLGERVLITSDGKIMRAVTKSETTPARWSVMGIAD